MRIDEFTADEFLTSAQMLAEVAEEAMGGKLGEELKRSYMSYRAAAKAAKAEELGIPMLDEAQFELLLAGEYGADAVEDAIEEEAEEELD